MSSDGDQFSKHAAAVARELFGAENPKLSTKDELRFGDRGRHSVDLKKGTYFDHHEGEGFGVLGLIQRETGKGGREAVEWMREHGFHIEERDAPPPVGHSAPTAAQGERKGPRYDRNGNWLPNRVPDHAELTKVYDYTEADGTLRYQVARFDWTDDTKEKGRDKTFVQRVPEPGKPGRFSYSLKDKGVEPLPYRLAELLEDIRDGVEIFIAPAEKKVDMLRELGVPATCNSGGESRFPEELAPYFKGAKVTVIEDNDDVGRKYSGKVAAVLEGHAQRVRYLRIPGLPPHGNVDDWLPAGGSAEELYELAKAAPIAGIAEFESRFGAVSWQDIDAPGPVYEELIEDVLTEGELSLLLGESQSGKSFLAIDIAMAVGRGIPWFGHNVRKGGVIYQAGESAVGVRRQRLPAYRRHFDVAHERIPFVLLQDPLDLYSGDDPTDAFIDECRHWGRTFGEPLRLIVIDTLNKAHPGANENDGKDMGIVLARCDRIRRSTGAHVMLVHHLNASKEKARGHTSLFANVENVIVVSLVPDHSDADQRKMREWRVAKQKGGEDGEKQQFVLRGIQIGVKPSGKPLLGAIVAAPAKRAGEELERPDGIRLTDDYALAYRLLHDLLRDVLIASPAPPELGLQGGSRMVARSEWSARFYSAVKEEGYEELAEDDKKKAGDAMRQKFLRVRKHLTTKGLIGTTDSDPENGAVGMAWLTGKPVAGFGPPPGTRRERERQAEADDAAKQSEMLKRAFGDDNPEDFK